MAAETNLDRADWHPSPLPEDGVISPEHLALVDFAQRLGSVTYNDEPGIVDAGDVQQHANLLMSLLASPPHVVTDDVEHSSVSTASVIGSVAHDHHYMSDASNSTATTRSSSSGLRRDNFRLCHPSLSLDCKWKTSFQRPLRTPCTAPDKDEDSAGTPPPAVLLGQSLKIDDREAHRLSADAMARNLLLSFQKAIKWRVQSWIDVLSASLVRKEKELIRLNATEEELRELVQTREAVLIMRLRDVAECIEVLHAETCFHVLPQRAQRERNEESDRAPLQKRRRIDSEDSELRMGETEYEYTVGHSLEFDGTIHLKTPAGHCEINLEVPGIIEGTFLSSEPGMEDLTAVEVVIDTNILASMVEKSCRMIVRASVEHICQNMVEVAGDEVGGKEESRPAESFWPLPQIPRASEEGHGVRSDAAIVTPRCSKTAPYLSDVAKADPDFLQIPDDLENPSGVRIPPQPRSPDMLDESPYTPFTPSQEESKRPLPSMVSPAANGECINDGGFRLAKRGAKMVKNGPNLPVLVEVACAAMQAKAGLTLQ